MKKIMMLSLCSLLLSVAYSPPSRGDTPDEVQQSTFSQEQQSVVFVPTESIKLYDMPSEVFVVNLKANHTAVTILSTEVTVSLKAQDERMCYAPGNIKERNRQRSTRYNHCPFDHGLLV